MTAPRDIGRKRDSYRCSTCEGRSNRCKRCREARAAYRRELFARKRKDGICIWCTRKAPDGTLCTACQKMATKHSRESHARSRGW